MTAGMNETTKLSRRLLEIALKTYRAEILSGLKGSNRYVGAMVGNAVDIAARGIAADDPTARLIERIGKADDAGELASAIREGKISEASDPGLHDALMDFVRARLAISNPRFLQRREG